MFKQVNKKKLKLAWRYMSSLCHARNFNIFNINVKFIGNLERKIDV